MNDGGFPEEWRQLSTCELASALVEQVAAMRRETAHTVAMLAYADQRGTTADLGYGSAGDMYAVIARVSRKEGLTMAARATTLQR